METYPLILLFTDGSRRQLQAYSLPDAMRTAADIIERNGLDVENMHTGLRSNCLIIVTRSHVDEYGYKGGC
jgi:hypothetical protein